MKLKEQIKQDLTAAMKAKEENKMQAMGQIMNHFGTTADGNTVKDLLQQM